MNELINFAAGVLLLVLIFSAGVTVLCGLAMLSLGVYKAFFDILRSSDD